MVKLGQLIFRNSLSLFIKPSLVAIKSTRFSHGENVYLKLRLDMLVGMISS